MVSADRVIKTKYPPPVSEWPLFARDLKVFSQRDYAFFLTLLARECAAIKDRKKLMEERQFLIHLLQQVRFGNPSSEATTQLTRMVPANGSADAIAVSEFPKLTLADAQAEQVSLTEIAVRESVETFFYGGDIDLATNQPLPPRFKYNAERQSLDVFCFSCREGNQSERKPLEMITEVNFNTVSREKKLFGDEQRFITLFIPLIVSEILARNKSYLKRSEKSGQLSSPTSALDFQAYIDKTVSEDVVDFFKAFARANRFPILIHLDFSESTEKKMTPFALLGHLMHVSLNRTPDSSEGRHHRLGLDQSCYLSPDFLTLNKDTIKTALELYAQLRSTLLESQPQLQLPEITSLTQQEPKIMADKPERLTQMTHELLDKAGLPIKPMLDLIIRKELIAQSQTISLLFQKLQDGEVVNLFTLLKLPDQAEKIELSLSLPSMSSDKTPEKKLIVQFSINKKILSLLANGLIVTTKEQLSNLIGTFSTSLMDKLNAGFSEVVRNIAQHPLKQTLSTFCVDQRTFGISLMAYSIGHQTTLSVVADGQTTQWFEAGKLAQLNKKASKGLISDTDQVTRHQLQQKPDVVTLDRLLEKKPKKDQHLATNLDYLRLMSLST